MVAFTPPPPPERLVVVGQRKQHDTGVFLRVLFTPQNLTALAEPQVVIFG
jgi:hypothetical protein